MHGGLAADNALFRAVLLVHDARRRLGELFHLVLASAATAPTRAHKVSAVHPFEKTVERLRIHNALVHPLFRFAVEVLRNFAEQCTRFPFGVRKIKLTLFAGVAAEHSHLAIFDVARSEFDPDRHPFHLPFVELPAGRIVAVVDFYAYSCPLSWRRWER